MHQNRGELAVGRHQASQHSKQQADDLRPSFPQIRCVFRQTVGEKATLT